MVWLALVPRCSYRQFLLEWREIKLRKYRRCCNTFVLFEGLVAVLLSKLLKLLKLGNPA